MEITTFEANQGRWRILVNASGPCVRLTTLHGTRPVHNKPLPPYRLYVRASRACYPVVVV